eukprot:CAMPEP_0184327874 /NCGR_PEP_ID=MMETSP1049-20130417/143323_1 /TAXON_ID=77928 /ORGANISM="Proteomonas sulcata, Strain CCMP704" /LENGTH=40 /DNA_ID= /DNA_START= /DNA_END= /DNA_ORIENTATION=
MTSQLTTLNLIISTLGPELQSLSLTPQTLTPEGWDQGCWI